MHTKDIEKNLKLYSWFQILREPLFWGPILITYIMARSMMSLADIFFMEGIVVFFLAILQVPTGALADKIGRRKTIIIGMFLELIHIAIFIFITKPWHVWVENAFWCIGFAMITGADQSFLYDNLKTIGKEHEYKKYQGRAIAVRMYLVAICSIAVGFLAKIDIRLPAILSFFPIVATFLITFFFKEPPMLTDQNKIIKGDGIILSSMIFVVNHAKLKWLIAFSASVAVISKLWFFTYNPYFELVKLPFEYYGIIFSVLNIVAATSSYLAHNMARKFTNLTSISIILSGVSIPIIVMGVWPISIFAWLVVVQNISRGYYRPFIEHLIHDEIHENRATVASIQSSVDYGVTSIMLIFFSRAILVNFTLPMSLIILGVFGLCVSLVLIVSYRRIFK